MRLTCPNCAAEYEVDQAALPAPGRDVQCSQCAHVWFQPLPEAAAPVAPLVLAAQAAGPGTAAGPGAALGPGAAPGHMPDAAAQAESLPRRRAIDADVLAVLREEAERETRARQAEATSLFAHQEELPLQAPAGAPAASAAIATAKSAAAPRPAAPPPNPAGALQDGAAQMGADQAQPARGGFWRGFLLALAAVLLALGLYRGAGDLARAAPALAPGLAAYTESVDQARLWLDGHIAPVLAPILVDMGLAPR